MLLEALIATNTLSAAALVVAVRHLVLHRLRRRQRNLLSAWPIPRIAAGDIAPGLKAGPLGPPPASEIVGIANYRVPGGISDLETWILCNLAKDARLIFEFGTATGKTTYLLARNAPPEARVVTLTLDPRTALEHASGPGDARERRALVVESLDTFVYLGTAAEPKITQLFGDSKTFDESPFAGRCDLVLVDGSHERSYVASDSRKALRMLRPGGYAFWHDYAGPRQVPGVYDALNELARDVPLRHIEGTMLVMYRKPA